MVKADEFFASPTAASRVKQAIVANYFEAWANVVKNGWKSSQLGYLDLYSGPGRYADGSPSTPLLILQHALKDEQLSKRLVAHFNDDDSSLALLLKNNIKSLPRIELLGNRWQVHNLKVSSEMMNVSPRVPSLLFADPWGYKGLSITLIERFMAVPGSDCILFFNYNRINAGLSFSGFDEPLDAVFGAERAKALRAKLVGANPAQRETLVLDEMEAAIREIGAHCVLAFRFKSSLADRPSHHILFASRKPLGCRIMKDVMSKYSSAEIQGIGTFEFGPAGGAAQQHLPGMGPFDALKDGLLEQFAGRKLAFEQLLNEHQHSTATERAYRTAILQLRDAGALEVTLLGRPLRAGTLPKDSVITFKGGGGLNG